MEEKKQRLKQGPERGVGWAFTGEDVGEPPYGGTSLVDLLVKSLQPAVDCSVRESEQDILRRLTEDVAAEKE